MKKAVSFFIVLLITTIVSGCSVKKVQELTDAEKFSNEFNVPVENPFIYTNIDNTLNIFDHGTGIIFFANSDQEGSMKAAFYIIEVAKKLEVKNIYYLDPNKVKEKNNKKYIKLLKYLNQNDKSNEDNNENNLLLPDIYAIVNGKVMCHSNYFSEDEDISEENLTKKKIKQIKQMYTKILKYEECKN